MKTASLALLSLNAFLWGTYYVATKQALVDIDPVTFAAVEVGVTLPLALIVIWRTKRVLNADLIRRGVTLGASLFVAILASTLALRRTTATNTAFFPALNGSVASLLSLVILGVRQRPAVWYAGGVSCLGAAIVFGQSASTGLFLGDVLALVAAILYAIYIFVVDRQRPSGLAETWLVFGIELVVVGVLATIVAVMFGSWNLLEIKRRIGVVLYVGVATTFLPAAISISCQRYIRPVVVAFLYALEPIWGAVLAFFILKENIGKATYLGGALIVAGSFAAIALEHFDQGSHLRSDVQPQS
jgi:drug/metabolite transporter (DMT)-like permease